MACRLYRERRRLVVFLRFIGLASAGLLSLASSPSAEDTWRGLTVAPEHRCSPYNQRDYRYPQSVEPRIVAQLGQIYGPYTWRRFSSMRETDIEHIVARSEAHDSGLCAADLAARRRFASDLVNLTLAAPGLNRHDKRDHDAAGWLPPMNRCWFANRMVEVRRKYRLTIDRREADVLEGILSSCSSTEIVFRSSNAAPPESTASPASPNVAPPGDVDALRLWDDNHNGRITCREARRHGIAPVPRVHPAYPFMRDADADGVVCE